MPFSTWRELEGPPCEHSKTSQACVRTFLGFPTYDHAPFEESILGSPRNNIEVDEKRRTLSSKRPRPNPLTSSGKLSLPTKYDQDLGAQLAQMSWMYLTSRKNCPFDY